TGGGAIPDTADYDVVEEPQDLKVGTVSELRRAVAGRSPEEGVAWLVRECGLAPDAAGQLVAYVAATRAALGTVPTREWVAAERFFDEGGGMQLVVHAPFGGRINRAWGLALRKS